MAFFKSFVLGLVSYSLKQLRETEKTSGFFHGQFPREKRKVYFYFSRKLGHLGQAWKQNWQISKRIKVLEQQVVIQKALCSLAIWNRVTFESIRWRKTRFLWSCAKTSLTKWFTLKWGQGWKLLLIPWKCNDALIENDIQKVTIKHI